MHDSSLGMVDAKTRMECCPPPGFRRGTGARRRILSLPSANSACQHVMSRMVDGLTFWDDVEKEALDRLLRKMADFLGVQLLTHTVMGNHFHALLEIPDKEQWLARFDGPEGEMAFWTHLATFYQGDSLARLRRSVDAARQSGRQGEAERIIGSIKHRMCDVSVWAKEVRERYSRWLNRRRNRQGTIWMARFRNVLVQDGRALQSMAAYIEFNPVRAGLVAHPRDYRWCGLASALRGVNHSISGVSRLIALANAGAAERRPPLQTYEDLIGLLFEEAARTEKTKDHVEPVIYTRQRGFSEGMAVGDASWIEEVAGQHQSHFGLYRRGRPKRLPGEPSTLVLRLDHRTS